jgi:hypothetical protein
MSLVLLRAHGNPAKGHPEHEGTNPVIGQGVFYVCTFHGIHLHELSPGQSSWKPLLEDIEQNPVIWLGVLYVPSQGLHLHELSPGSELMETPC